MAALGALSIANSIPAKLEQLLGTSTNGTAAVKGFIRVVSASTVVPNTVPIGLSSPLTVPGVVVGDSVIAVAPSSVVADQHVIGGSVTAANTVVLTALNVNLPTAAARTYTIIVAKLV